MFLEIYTTARSERTRSPYGFRLRNVKHCFAQDDRGKEIYFMYYIYILSNIENRIFYIGVTNDLKRRIYEHKHKLLDGFTKKYNLGKLLYFEIFKDISLR